MDMNRRQFFKVCGVGLGASSLAALAAWLVTSPADTLWWTLAPAMLLAGIGGGGVISPNFTLTLAEVPPRMGGASARYS